MAARSGGIALRVRQSDPQPGQAREWPRHRDRHHRESSAAHPRLPQPGLDDDYRCFIVDPAIDTDMFLTAYEVLPG